MKKFLDFWAMNSKKIYLVLLALALIFPLVVTKPYLMNVAVLCFLYTTLSLSLNLVTGYMGQLSLGHAAFYGVGAYAGAICATRLNCDFLLTIVIAAVVAALVGLILSLPILRLKGRYLAIVTLAFCEITRLVELNWVDVTGGPMGISSIPAPHIFGFVFKSTRSKYYLIVAITLVTILIVHNLMNSRTGRSISAIKGDEIAASAMGINVFKYKVICFTIASALAGVAGAFYACYMRYVDPTSFAFDQSVQILGMTILGGLGSIPGSVIGAFVLTAIPEMLRGLLEFRQVIYGLILAIMVVFKPSGLLGNVNFKHIRQRVLFARANAKKGGGDSGPAES